MLNSFDESGGMGQKLEAVIELQSGFWPRWAGRALSFKATPHHINALPGI